MLPVPGTAVTPGMLYQISYLMKTKNVFVLLSVSVRVVNSACGRVRLVSAFGSVGVGVTLQ